MPHTTMLRKNKPNLAKQLPMQLDGVPLSKNDQLALKELRQTPLRILNSLAKEHAHDPHKTRLIKDAIRYIKAWRERRAAIRARRAEVDIS